MRLVIRLAILVVVVAVVSFSRYRSNSAPSSVGARPVQSAPGTPVAHARQGDPKPADSKAEAQRRWPAFVAAFKNPGAKTGFAVRYAFPHVAPLKSGGTVEHVWINVTAISSNHVTGTFDDRQPVSDIGYKQGETVTLTADELEDWVYFENDTMVGGFGVTERGP